jgi:hypothetical protein
MYRQHLERMTRTRLDDLLLDEGILDRAKLESVQAEQDQSGRLLSDLLVETCGFDEWELAKLQANRYGLPFLDVKLYGIRREVSAILPLDWCRSRGLLPLDQFGPTIALACWEIPTPELVQEIIEKTSSTPFLYVGVRRAILEVLQEQIAKAPGASRPGGATLAGGKPAAAPQPSVSGKPAVTLPESAPAAVASPMGAAASPYRSETGLEPELPPLDLPLISMKLNASASAVGGMRRTVPSPRPAPSVPAGLSGVSPAASVAGASASHTGVSVVGSTPAPAAAPTPAAEPPRPRFTRSAPTLPPAPAAPAGGAKPAMSGWESIFDSGEDAVRRSVPGGPPRPAAPDPRRSAVPDPRRSRP